MVLSRHIAWIPGAALLLSTAAPLQAAQRIEDLPVAERFEVLQEQSGIRLGGFTLRPELDLEYAADDNIFSDERDEESDLVGRYSGQANLASNWSQHALRAGAKFESQRYQDNSSENADDYEVSMGGRLDLGIRNRVRADVRSGRSTLSRDSVESRLGTERLRYDYQRFNGGLERRYGVLTASVYGALEDRDYDDSTVNSGISNQRDNELKRLSTRLTYGGPERTAYYLDLSFQDNEYDEVAQVLDFDRSSHTRTMRIGATFALSGLLHGYGEVGYLDKNYDGQELDDRSGLIADAGLTWNVTRLTTVTGSIRRGFESTTLSNSPGYRDHQIGLSIDHELLRTLRLSARVVYQQQDYERIDRAERDVDYELSAHYLMGRSATLKLFHRSEHRSSQGFDQGRDYEGNVFGLGIRLAR